MYGALTKWWDFSHDIKTAYISLFQLSCSYVQIYKEKIYDLLNANPKIDLFLRENPTRGKNKSASFCTFLSC